MFNSGSDPGDLLIEPLLGGSGGNNVVRTTHDPVSGTVLSAAAGTKSFLQAGAMVARSRGNIECIGKGETGQASVAGAGVTNKTWQRIIALRGVPLIARAQYVNPNTSGYTVDKTNIKLSTTFVAGGDPTGSMTPLNFLWSASASVTLGAGALDVPVYSAWSDPLLLPTVARSDAATRTLAYVRSWLNLGTYPYNGAQFGYASNPNNVAAGLVRSFGFATGDFIATPTGFSDNNGASLLMNLEFTEFCRGIKIASVGDSITSGSAAAGGSNGGWDNTFVDQALALINSSTVSYGTILSHSNCGVASTYLTQYLPRIPTILTQQTPDVVIVPVWSPNNSPTTQALLDGNNALVLRAIAQILASGAVPILWTSPPQNSTTAAIDALRVSNNTFWRNVAAQNGFYLADFASVLDGSSVANVTQYAAGTSTDGTHPNAEGQTQMAAVLVPILKAAAGVI